MKKILAILLVALLFAGLSVSAFADVSVYLSVGTPATDTVYSAPDGITISNLTLSGGALPPGVDCAIVNSKYITLAGTPTASGSYYFTLAFISTDMSSNPSPYAISVSASVTGGGGDSPTPTPSPSPVAVTVPSITKNPTDENIVTGESAVFIARADGTDTITWYIVDNNGASFLATELPNRVSGVTVSGADSEKLIISHAGVNISGYSAYAVFSNAAGTSTSQPARVNVTAATPSPTPTQKPSPSPRPTQTPKPSPTATPAPSPTPTFEIAPEPTPTENPINSVHHSSGNGGMTVLLILVLLVMISAATILILYVKGVINLDWLEDWLNKKK